MKTLGLIGGTTWISTADYYRNLNQQINEILGGLNSAQLLLYSVNFENYQPPVNPDEWRELSKKFTGIAQKLESAGADCIVFCANTPHMAADYIQRNIGIPIIHIAEAAANEISANRIQKVALLGTRITMEQDFFKSRLINKQIEVLVPNAEDRQVIHNAVFNEMAKDIFSPRNKNKVYQHH